MSYGCHSFPKPAKNPVLYCTISLYICTIILTLLCLIWTLLRGMDNNLIYCPPNLVFLLIFQISVLKHGFCHSLCFLFIPSSWLFFSVIFLLLPSNCSSFLVRVFGFYLVNIFFEIPNCYDRIWRREIDLPGLNSWLHLYCACRS